MARSHRFARSWLVLAVALAPAVAGCKADPKLTARVELADGGPAIVVLRSPDGKEARGPAPDPKPAAIETDATRAAFKVEGGWRVVHLVSGKALASKEVVPDWRARTFEADAGNLFAIHESARADVLARARAEGGDDAVVRALADSADLRDKAWDDAQAALAAGPKQKLADRLKKSLDVGGSPTGLLRAVVATDLQAPDVAPKLGARVSELGAKKAPTSPRALGIMLRALARSRREEAGAVACKVLEASPAEPAAGTGDAAGVRPLVDAALLAIAASGASCKDAVMKTAGQDRCAILFRCKPGGARLAQNEASDQKEPLCTKEMLQAEVATELARPPSSLATGEEYWTERYGLAALWAQGPLPPEWARGHERRRYDLTQPASPECGMDLKPGTACHCDEVTLRDQACRNDSSPVQVGFCKFEIDDKKRLISNVIYYPM